MNPIQTLFPGSQIALYRVGTATANIITENLDGYAAYKKKYTPAFVTAFKNSVEAAKALPGYDSRQGTSSLLRTTLSEANKDFLFTFAGLLGYIEDSFPPSKVDDQKKIAGGDWYTAALNEDWSASATIVTMGNAFITSNSAALVAGGMPEDFPASFSAGADAFEVGLSAFTNYKNTGGQDASAKTEANNALYAAILSILKDGRYVLGANKTMKKQLTYSALHKKVKGPGKTGFRIALKLKDILAPVSTASISFMPTGKTFTANEKGVIEDTLPENAYSYTITAPGLATVHGHLKITAGVVRHKKIEMTAATALKATA